MTGNDGMFTLLEDPGYKEQVTFGDNSKGKVIGLGKLLSLTICQFLTFSLLSLRVSIFSQSHNCAILV